MIDCREWNRVCEESIVAKYTVMKSASDEFGEFKSLVAQVSVNLIYLWLITLGIACYA